MGIQGWAIGWCSLNGMSIDVIMPWMKHNQIHHPNFPLSHWPTKHDLRARLWKQGQWATGNQDVCDIWVDILTHGLPDKLVIDCKIDLSNLREFTEDLGWSATNPPMIHRLKMMGHIFLRWHLDWGALRFRWPDTQWGWCIYTYICPLNYPNLGV